VVKKKCSHFSFSHSSGREREKTGGKIGKKTEQKVSDRNS
jgi:hypothetical protein